MRQSQPKVLVVHNRYRLHGGEERAVELQLSALERAGVVHGALLRDSAGVARARAGLAMLRGGERPEAIARAVRELGATVVHAHNMQPLIGPRALSAARAAGAAVVLHLHNFRLFCSIAVAYRDGAPCFRCRRRITLPGLALNCRGSLPESAVYTAALALHQPRVMGAVDLFLAPSRYAAGQLVRLGVPAQRIEALAHYLPATEVAGRSAADGGEFALVNSRLAPEKGVDTAIEAAALSRVPLKVAGEGPLEPGLRLLIDRIRAPVELLGPVSGAELRDLRRRAAMAVVPTSGNETFGYAALGAMGAGVPVVATTAGALPEIVGAERCVPRSDAPALATAMSRLWQDPERRRSEGDELIEWARHRFGEERYVSDLLALYRRLG